MRFMVTMMFIVGAATIAIVPILGPYLGAWLMNLTNALDTSGEYVEFTPEFFKSNKEASHE